MVYFIKCNDLVKIGFSCDVNRRFKQLKTANGKPLELIHSIKGDRTVEKALHNRYKDLKVRGEWFKLYPEIQMWIDYDKLSRRVLKEEGLIK